MSRPRRWLVALVLLITLLAAAAFVLRPRPDFRTPTTTDGIDLSRPDLLIRSQSLSALPADIVRAPLLREIVTEDLVHYYESHPALLSLSGTARRLAFDHGLNIADRIIASALASPAEVALWRNARGQPDRFVLKLDHGLASRAVLELAKVALPDRQLTVAGTLGSGAALYALQWSSRDTWLIASRGDRVVVVSSPGMALGEGGAPAPVAARLIDRLLDAGDSGVSSFAAAFGLAPLDAASRHDVAARSGLLAFGYEHFFPGLDALRLRLGTDGAWRGSVRIAADARARWLAGAPALWSALPRDSALCAVLPWQPERARPIAQAALGDDASTLLKAVDPNAAVCWNDAGGLFAPMLATRLGAGGNDRVDPMLGTLLEATLRKPASESTANTDPDADAGAERGRPAAVDPRAGLDRLAFQTQGGPRTIDGLADSRLWLRGVEHPLGATVHDGRRGHGVAVARVERLLLAAVDARALQPALAVASRTWPALSDDPVAAGHVPVLAIDGPRLARLLDAATWRTLTPGRTPTFHRVARELLPPRLQAVAGLGRLRIAIDTTATARPDPAAGADWLPLDTTRIPSTLPGSGQPIDAPVPTVSAAR